MPVENDLTPEERKLFADQGVQPAPEGGEIPDGSEEQQDQQQQQQQQQQHGDRSGEEQQQQHADRGGDEPTLKVKRDPKTGRFIPVDGTEQQGEQQQQQEGQQGDQGQQQAGEQQQQQPKMVPHEALHAEREKAKQLSQNLAVLSARMNALLSQRGEQQQGGEEAVDLATDPVKFIQNLEKRLNQFEQVRQAENQYREIDAGIQQDEQAFEISTPDYDVASEYYVNSRAKELLAFHTPAQAQQILLQEARQIAQQSWARGISAAQSIYGLAQARGYVPGQQQQQQQQQQEQGQQGQGQQQQQKGPTPAAVVAAAKNGQQQSRSLSGGMGSGAVAELNAQAILSMSDEEFEAALGIGEKGTNARFAAIAGR